MIQALEPSDVRSTEIMSTLSAAHGFIEAAVVARRVPAADWLAAFHLMDPLGAQQTVEHALQLATWTLRREQATIS